MTTGTGKGRVVAREGLDQMWKDGTFSYNAAVVTGESKHAQRREMIIKDQDAVRDDVWDAGEKLGAPDGDTDIWASGKTLDTPEPGYLAGYDLWELDKATDQGRSEPPVVGESLLQIQNVISTMDTVELDALTGGIVEKNATLQGVMDSAERDLRDQFSRGDRSEQFAAAGVTDGGDPQIVQKCLPSITFGVDVGMRNSRLVLDAIEARARQLTNEEDGPVGPA